MITTHACHTLLDGGSYYSGRRIYLLEHTPLGGTNEGCFGILLFELTLREHERPHALFNSLATHEEQF